MKTLAANNLAAIADGRIVQREFLSITVRDNVTDAPSTFNFWSDMGSITVNVYNPETGTNEGRTFIGAGGLIEMTPVAHVSSLIIQDVTFTLSALQTDVEDTFRNYNTRQAKIQLWRGWLDPDTRDIVEAAEPFFMGFMDTPEVITGDDGNPSVITARCVSIAQQMVRYNPETRSDEYQRLRNASDGFFKDASTVREWELFWGTKNGKVQTQSGVNLRDPFGSLASG